jgi:hypothetical protein
MVVPYFLFLWYGELLLSTDTSNKKMDIENRSAELVPGLKVKELYVSFEILCSWENCNLGVGYDTLFASSLVPSFNYKRKK